MAFANQPLSPYIAMLWPFPPARVALRQIASKGPCTAGGKLAAEALRVLKKSTQHAGARKARLGRRPLIPA